MSDLAAEKRLLQEGVALFRAGNLDKAEETFRKFINTYPESDLADNACYNLASIYLKRNDLWKALEWLEFLIQNFPESDAAEVAKDEAVEVMKMLNIGPKELPYEKYLAGKLKLGEGQITEAEKIFQEFIEKYPASDLIDNAHYNLAIIYKKQGLLDKARKHVDIIMNEYPESDAALYAEDLLAE